MGKKKKKETQKLGLEKFYVCRIKNSKVIYGGDNTENNTGGDGTIGTDPTDGIVA